MIRRAPIRLLALAAVALASCERAGEPPAATERRDPAFVETLDADILLVESLRRALEAEPQTLDAWRRELSERGGWSRERDVGFGARRLVVTLGGGHTSAEVALLAADDAHGQVARVSVHQYPHYDASGSDVSPALARAWGRGEPTSFVARFGDDGVRVERADAARVAELDARRARELGEARPESPPGALAEAYGTLLDPLATLCVGTFVGFDFQTPPGREASRALAAAGRVDLLRCVLRGPNPEARAYAAHELLESGSASAADAAAIEALSRLPIQLSTCGGCLVGSDDWADALEQLREP